MKRITARHLLIINITFWVVLAFLFILQNYASSLHLNKPVNWLRLGGYYIPFNFSLMVLGIPVYFIHLKLQSKSLSHKTVVHIISAIVFGILHVTFYLGVISIITNQKAELTFVESLQEELYFNFPRVITSIVMYGFIVLVLTLVDFYNKYQEESFSRLELENKLSTTELQALKMQLHPHFLFNAFNTISMMVIRDKKEEAVDMIAGVSDLLRSALSQKEKQYITFEEELLYVKKYLEIERTRFRDRLKISYDIQDIILKQLVPNLILQPILENAFKHGISITLDQAFLQIKAKQISEELKLTIINSGPQLPEKWDINVEKNIGLTNVIDRLGKLYDSNYGFTISNFENVGVIVEIILPAS